MPCKSSLQTRTSKAIIEIQISDIYNIKAPSYVLYPEITEATQIENAMKTYNVKPIKENEH